MLGGEHRRERTALLESASPLEDCLLLVPERSNDRQELGMLHLRTSVQ